MHSLGHTRKQGAPHNPPSQFGEDEVTEKPLRSLQPYLHPPHPQPRGGAGACGRGFPTPSALGAPETGGSGVRAMSTWGRPRAEPGRTLGLLEGGGGAQARHPGVVDWGDCPQDPTSTPQTTSGGDPESSVKGQLCHCVTARPLLTTRPRRALTPCSALPEPGPPCQGPGSGR